MRDAEAPEDRLALRRDDEKRLTAIGLARSPLDQAGADGALRQLDGAVVLDLEPLRDRADRRPRVERKPLDRQQELMLLRFDAGGAGCRLAEDEKAAEPIPDLRERAVFAGRDGASSARSGGGRGSPASQYIVARYYFGQTLANTAAARLDRSRPLQPSAALRAKTRDDQVSSIVSVNVLFGFAALSFSPAFLLTSWILCLLPAFMSGPAVDHLNW